MQLDDGGPAFPRPRGYHPTPVPGDPALCEQEGMSLRDYFAAHAMAAIVSQARLNPCGDFVADDCLLQHHNAPRLAARTAYSFADAMLVARSKLPPDPEPSDSAPERAG